MPKQQPLTSHTKVFSWDVMHTLLNGLTERQVLADADISNMQDAGISLEKSAAAGEGQRGFSCHSCMQQAVQIGHYFNRPLFLSTRNWNTKKRKEIECTFFKKTHQIQFDWFLNEPQSL